MFTFLDWKGPVVVTRLLYQLSLSIITRWILDGILLRKHLCKKKKKKCLVTLIVRWPSSIFLFYRGRTSNNRGEDINLKYPLSRSLCTPGPNLLRHLSSTNVISRSGRHKRHWFGKWLIFRYEGFYNTTDNLSSHLQTLLPLRFFLDI